MSSLKPKQAGQVLVEFLIVSILLMLMVWYGIMGGSGSWRDADREPNHGNLARTPPPAQPSPGLLQTLNDRQHDFSNSLGQP